MFQIDKRRRERNGSLTEVAYRQGNQREYSEYIHIRHECDVATLAAFVKLTLFGKLYIKNIIHVTFQ